MWSSFTFIFLSFFFFSITSCSRGEVSSNLTVVAQVGEGKLYAADLRALFGSEVVLGDLNVKVYVDNWIRNEAVLQHGAKQILPEEINFDKELKDYHNSLLRHQIESNYLEKHLDTVIKVGQIKAYYDKNYFDFKLEEHYVKGRIMKISRKFSEKYKRKSMISYEDSQGKETFNRWVEKNHLFVQIFENSWTKWEDIKTLIPLVLQNDEQFLNNTRYKEVWQESDLWVMRLTNVKLIGAKTPLDLIVNKVKSILINKRKMDLIRRMEKEFYQEAVSHGEVKINIEGK